MKVFDFKPRLFSALKNYSKETFMADLMAGIIVGIVALPLAIAFGIASGVTRKGNYHGYHCGVHHLAARRKQSTDRRTYRSIHCHHLWHHPAIRRSRIDCSYPDGRHTPYLIGSF